MKDKVITFIIGFLVGAIIATGGFLIYEKTKSSNNIDNNNPQQMMMPDGNMPQMPGGNKMQGGPKENMDQNGQMIPPDMPNGQQQNNSTDEGTQNLSEKMMNKKQNQSNM